MRLAIHSPSTDPYEWPWGLQEIPPGFAGYTLDCPYPLPNIPSATIRALRTWKERYNLNYFVHTPVGHIRLGDPDPLIRQTSLEQMQRAIHLAALVGAILVVVHPTPCPTAHPCPPAGPWEQQALSVLCSEAAHYRVSIAIENIPPNHGFSPGYSDFSSLLALLEQIPDLGITLDVGHAHLAGIPLAAIVRCLGHRLSHVHVHDNNGLGDQHLPVGQGTIHWSGLLRALASIKYKGFLELEFPGYANQIAAKAYLEQLLAEMQSEGHAIE